jgi:exopolysaccharide production protein ExoY
MKVATLSYQTATFPKSKRLFDIVFSAAVLIVFSPLFLLIALLIRLTSPGKAIFSQERLGLHGKVFTCFKFRTMLEDADEKLAHLLEADSVLNAEWKKHQKLKKDPRLVKLGAFLRMTSLDELPQFYNVLRGDLSVVGPRPYMTAQLPILGLHACKVLSVKPGITGLWQTSGRSSATFRERIALDIAYIDNQSFALDLVLIAKTLPLVVLAKNAH